MHWEQVSYEKVTVRQGDATVYPPEVRLFSITHLLPVHYPAYSKLAEVINAYAVNYV